MAETTADESTTLAIDVAGKTTELEFGPDMVLNTRTGEAEVKVEDSPLVFVGYGVDAPEQDWNDYAGIDVEDKTVVILVNDPGFHARSEEHTSELQSLMRISYAVFCLKKKKEQNLPTFSSKIIPIYLHYNDTTLRYTDNTNTKSNTL